RAACGALSAKSEDAAMAVRAGETRMPGVEGMRPPATPAMDTAARTLTGTKTRVLATAVRCERNRCAAALRSRSMRLIRNLPMLRLFNRFRATANRTRWPTGRQGAGARSRRLEDCMAES